MSHYSVYLGAVGWAHPEWRGGLYPEDLPEDWELSFYNTQFRCVYLPSKVWCGAADEEVARWLEETREDFRFVLQLPEKLDENARRLAERFGGRSVSEAKIELLWLGIETDLRNLAQRIQQAAQSGPPLYLVSREGSLTQLRQVSELIEVLGV